MDSDYDSGDSSRHSLSPQASPAASFAPPSLHRLVQCFTAAKHSLASTNYIFRANELVKSSRILVEEIAVLTARNAFTQRLAHEQVDTLYLVKQRIASVGEDAGEEFQTTIERLDLANDRLETTLRALRQTTVGSSLHKRADHPSAELGDTGDEDAIETLPPREQTLFDFIDETKHAAIQTSLRALIDTYQDLRADLHGTLHKIDESLKIINVTLVSNERVDKSPDIGTIYDEPPMSIPQLFHGMEDHATGMAGLLQSLVSHYDLCVSALKHTDGGGEAAKRAVQQQADDKVQSKDQSNGMEESLYLKTVPEPISDDERTDMLRVLENDAQEVDDVVGEIKERNQEQESLYEQLSRHAKSARSTDERMRQVLELLHEMKELHLPAHLHATTSFEASWKRIQTSIESQTAELVSLSSFYDGFFSGYARLLHEAERRNDASRQMRKVAEKANRELHRLSQADRRLREDFMEDTGKFLPQGIWNGLLDHGVQWELREVERDQD